jgi:hypothetical protein
MAVLAVVLAATTGLLTAAQVKTNRRATWCGTWFLLWRIPLARAVVSRYRIRDILSSPYRRSSAPSPGIATPKTVPVIVPVSMKYTGLWTASVKTGFAVSA